MKNVLEGQLVKLISRYWDTIISINIQHVGYVCTYVKTNFTVFCVYTSRNFITLVLMILKEYWVC